MVAGLPPLIDMVCGVFFAPFWAFVDSGKYTYPLQTSVHASLLPDWTADVYHTEVFEKAFEALSRWKPTVLRPSLPHSGQW